MPELKKCPFCRHKAQHWMIGSYNRHIVQCNWCRIRTNEYATKEGAVKAWNRRTEVKEDAEIH